MKPAYYSYAQQAASIASVAKTKIETKANSQKRGLFGITVTLHLHFLLQAAILFPPNSPLRESGDPVAQTDLPTPAATEPLTP